MAGYRICGKTGTSEKVDKWNEDRTQDMEYIASYCGFAPAEDPQYALLVFFDEPDDDTNGGYNGGNAVAGPYFAKMMEEILPYLGVEAQYNEEEYANLDTVAPTVTGLTLEEAYAKLEEAGLTYSVIGDESDSSITVTAQVPEAGGAVSQGWPGGAVHQRLRRGLHLRHRAQLPGLRCDKRQLSGQALTACR